MGTARLYRQAVGTLCCSANKIILHCGIGCLDPHNIERIAATKVEVRANVHKAVDSLWAECEPAAILYTELFVVVLQSCCRIFHLSG